MLVKPKSTFTRTTGRLMCGILMASVISFGLSVPVSRAAGDSSAASTASSAPTASIAPTADSGGIEEIIVTAARREQSELTVPISITAFSAKELEANHVTDVEDYFALSPDVYITGAPDRVGLVSHTSGLRLAIRGISDIGGTSNSFGIYLDDLNINNATVNPYLVDIDRIEVLEGPQSTFFGRNAEAGVISIASKKPVDRYEAEGTVDYSSFDTTDFRGMVNVPIVPGLLLMRFATEIENSDGALKNVNPVGGDNGYNSQYGRLSIRALPTDRLTIDLSAAYSREHDDDYGIVNTGVVSSFMDSLCLPPIQCPRRSDGPFFPQNTTDYNHNDPLVVDSSYWILNSRVAYRADNYSITNILGYSTLKFIDSGELDFASYDFLREAFDKDDQNSLSDELRIQSEGSGALSWIVGGVFARDYAYEHEQVGFGSQNGFGVPAGFVIEDDNPITHTRTYALFAEANYKLLPPLTLTVGGRYSYEDLSKHYYEFDDFGDPIVDNGGKRSYDDFSPRVTLAYAWNSDVNTYATASKGWKAGGFQLDTGSVLPVNFGSETLWNYEVGTKAKLFDDRLQVSASAFFIKWNNVQVQTSVYVNEDGSVHSYSGISNNANASSRGMEFQLQARPIQPFQLGVNLGYTDAHFDTFAGAVTDYGTVDLSGQPLPLAPRWTASTNAQYDFMLGPAWKAFMRGEWSYASSSYTNVNGVTAANLEGLAFPFKLPSRNATNFRLGVDNGKYRIVGYVNNAFVHKGDYSAVFDFGFVDGAAVLPIERVFGIQLTARY
jgi:iron complex outermembrane receptor protein